jgi:cytidylate kinase
MIVTIAREFGAGGLSVGERLAEAIGAQLLDERTIIDDLARRSGFSAEFLRSIDERPPSVTSTFMQDLARATALVQAMDWRSTEQTVLDEIRDLVLERASSGHVVVIGHGGPKLLAGRVPRHEIFSILLHARREWRIEQVMRRFGIGYPEAAERVRKTDELRKRYLQHFFNADLYDARAYELVIDTERIGIPAAQRMTVDAVRSILDARAAPSS